MTPNPTGVNRSVERSVAERLARREARTDDPLGAFTWR
jgi:hypothetical protein